MRPIIQQLMHLLLIMQIIKTMLHLSTAFQKLMDYKLIQIDNAEDLDVEMPMYNLFEYSKTYKKATGSLWNYYKNEPNSGVNSGITYSIKGSKSFDYKGNFVKDGVTHNNLTKNDVKIVVPLKHLANFWRSLNIPLINCKANKQSNKRG